MQTKPKKGSIIDFVRKNILKEKLHEQNTLDKQVRGGNQIEYKLFRE